MTDEEKQEYIKIKDGIIDRSIKRNGSEYFTIGTMDFYKSNQAYNSEATIPAAPVIDMDDIVDVETFPFEDD